MNKIILLHRSQMFLGMQKLRCRLWPFESTQGRWIHLCWGTDYLAKWQLVLHIFCMGVNIGRRTTWNAASTGSAAVGRPLLMWFHSFIETVWFESDYFILFLLSLHLRLFGNVIERKPLVWRSKSGRTLIVRALVSRLFDLAHHLLVIHLAELVVLCRSWPGHVWG